MTDELLLRDVDVQGQRVDVRIRGSIIAEIGPGLRPSSRDAAEVFEGEGGALIPGLHDHHVHLLATAAARTSVRVGPADTANQHELARRLQRADATLPPGRWLRAVGYHEAVAGPLDRDRLDTFVPHRPARIQHRTGALWVLNTAAIEALDLDLDGGHAPGAERDDRGHLTGRFHRADVWLRERLPPVEPPELAAIGADLARYGVTGVTDATPFEDRTGPEALAAAVADGALPQRVIATGGIDLVDAGLPPELERGPVKLVIDDGSYPPLDVVAEQISLAHHHERPVAVHCVTRVALILALAAWQVAGTRRGDRIEHGSVVPPELLGSIAELGLTVVTQPAFVAERGDEYLTDVDPDDLPDLYRVRSLAAAGIEVAASSDAPYTDLDPWAAMRAAVTRRTRAGMTLGPDEAMTAAEALALYLGSPHRPGGPPRQVRVGERADLCLLAGPLPRTAADLRADRVATTIVASGTTAQSPAVIVERI